MLTWSAAVLLLRRAIIGVLLLRRRLIRPCQDRVGYDRTMIGYWIVQEKEEEEGERTEW